MAVSLPLEDVITRAHDLLAGTVSGRLVVDLR